MKNSINISQCDSEPIRFINSIQEFGAILITDNDNLIKGHSTNFFSYTETRERNLLDSVLSLKDYSVDNFHITKTKVEKLNVIQFEKHFTDNPSLSLNDFLNSLQSSENLNDLLSTSADLIAEISGFDRVMVYRFHDDFHGEVVAEKVRPGVESFLGLHYPASDIPTPARAVFLENWIRMIPDVNYTPVSIKTSLSEVIDLGQVLLRAVSPIHIQYLHNMKVGATLTISIIVDNKLWGLFACHNIEAKMVSKSLRDKCESIGRFTSSLVNVVLLKERTSHAEQVKKILQNLGPRLKNAEDMAYELSGAHPNLLHLIDTHGASAALYVDGYWANVGKTPNEEQLNQLVDWLSTEHSGTFLYHTNELSEQFPSALEYKKICSGLLAVSVPKTTRNYIIWFRPEVIQTVIWAGNPDKSVSSDTGHLSPRGSFHEWKSTVEAKSLPWHPWEIDAALELRNLILATDLKKQFEKEQKARSEAERAIEAREDLMAVVSHDLKNPLNSIQMNAQLLKRMIPSNDTKSTLVVDRLLRSSVTMNNLINDILSIVKLEAGQFEIVTATAPIRLVVQEAIEMLQPMAVDKNILLIEASTNIDCNLKYDFDRILQVLSNLIGNAIKFTPQLGQIVVEIEKCGPTYLKMKITDTGPGITADNLHNVFDRFWQANHNRRLGTGLGLSIAKNIIESHGGEIWVESKPGEGASFQFTLPI